MKLRKKSGEFQFTQFGVLKQKPFGSKFRKPCLFYKRCECYRPFIFEELNAAKPKLDRTILSDGRPIRYPENSKTKNLKLLKTFKIQYEGSFSLLVECILNSFENKYIYYAIDDLLYLLKSNSKDRQDLLELLYSAMFSLHNNFSVNFFDIWIDSIFINHTYKNNRFLTNEPEKGKQVTYITLTLSYIVRSRIKKRETLW